MNYNKKKKFYRNKQRTPKPTENFNIDPDAGSFGSPRDLKAARRKKLIEILRREGKPAKLVNFMDSYMNLLYFKDKIKESGKFRQFIAMMVKQGVIEKSIIDGYSFIKLTEKYSTPPERTPREDRKKFPRPPRRDNRTGGKFKGESREFDQKVPRDNEPFQKRTETPWSKSTPVISEPVLPPGEIPKKEKPVIIPHPEDAASPDKKVASRPRLRKKSKSTPPPPPPPSPEVADTAPVLSEEKGEEKKKQPSPIINKRETRKEQVEAHPPDAHIMNVGFPKANQEIRFLHYDRILALEHKLDELDATFARIVEQKRCVQQDLDENQRLLYLLLD